MYQTAVQVKYTGKAVVVQNVSRYFSRYLGL